MPVAILMPALSPTMTEGNVAKWLKKVGDEIKSGDIIAEVETDKATMEVEAIDDGVLAKIVHNDGAENISVNSLIGVISIDDETEEDIELFLKKGSGFKKEIDKPETNEKINSENNASNETISSDDKNLINEENNASNETISSDDKNLINEENNASNETISSDDKNLINEESKKVEETNLMESQISISPLAKRIASLKNININDIKGTGPRGRIVKRDLEVFLQDESLPKPNLINKADKRATQFSNKIPLTNIRRTIATRLQQSKQSVPHFYLKSKVYADEIIQARQVMNSLYQNENNKIKISYNDIIIKSVASALKIVPEMNRTWNEDSVLEYNLVDISVAVATDDGLFTPVIRSACKKSISEISSEMKEFISRAKNNKLTPDDYLGGSFSISNLGMYDVHEFSAIINPPQSGILAIGEIFEELKMVEDKILKKNMINLVLSVDHRVADGSTAAIFLDKIKFFLENPLGMLA